MPNRFLSGPDRSNRFVTRPARQPLSTNGMGGRSSPVVVRPSAPSLVDHWIRDVDRRWERAVGGGNRNG